MKKLMVMALTVTLLFTGIGTTASAAATCTHQNKVQQGYEWRATGHGYYHPYSTSNGSVGCKVDTYRKYTVYSCPDCHWLELEPMDVYWDSHEVTSHNSPKP